MRRLRIAHIAPLWFTVPPTRYGGTERVVAGLVDGQVAAGHDVTLFAAPGSRTRGRLVSVSRSALSEMGVVWGASSWDIRNVSEAFGRAGEFDVIHSHAEYPALFFQDLVSTPVIHTLHWSLAFPKPDLSDRLQMYTLYRSKARVVFLSRAHRRTSRVRFRESYVVYNGVPTSHFRFKQKPDDYFLWIGRICRIKGIENAIAAARRAGVKLLLAGPVHAGNREYFQSAVRPYLTRKIQYIGEASQEELPALYGGARALLFPITWDEPFGLVIAESLSCGTPVIAYPRGSVPELVQDRKTGYIAHSVSDVVRCIRHIDEIDRSLCRRRAEDRFSNERMVQSYEALYRKVLGEEV